MERYSLISEKLNKNFNKNLNVEIQKYRIFNDNEANSKFIQIKVSNFSTKKVEELTIKITNLQTVKDEFITLKNLNISPNTSYSTDKPIYFEKEFDNAFEVSLYDNKNADKSLEKKNNNIVLVAASKAIIKRKVNFNNSVIRLDYKPNLKNGIWRCGCGFVNKEEFKKCSNCDITKDKLLRYQKQNNAIFYSLASTILAVPLLIQAIIFIPRLFSDFSFSKVENGYALTEYRGSDEVVTIPSEHRGQPVVELKSDLFSNSNNIKEIIIPESIETINRGSLACLPNLEKVTTPIISNYTQDGLRDFYYLFIQNQKCLDLFVGHTNRNQTPFGESVVPKGLKVVTISNQEELTSFAGLNSIEVLNLSEKTKIIVNDLHSMTQLKEINIDPLNKNFVSSQGVMYTINFGTILFYPANKIGDSYTINSQTRIVPSFAFNKNSNLKNLVVPNSVVSIEEKSFQNLRLNSLEIPFIGPTRGSIDFNLNYLFGQNVSNDLKELTISNVEYVSFKNLENLFSVWIINFSSSVERIEYGAFDNMRTLRAINFRNNNRFYKTIEGVLYSGDGTTLIKLPVARSSILFTIPDGVTKINPNALKNNIFIQELTIPKSVQVIEESTLSGLSDLRKLTTPFVGKSRMAKGYDGLLGHMFGTNTFNLSRNYKQVISFDAVDDKFYSIPFGLKEVNVTDSTRLSAGAFSRITSLEKVNLNQEIDTMENLSFFATTNIKAIDLPKNLVAMEVGVFQRSGLETIFLPKSLIYQGYGTFWSSTNLKEIRVEHSTKPSNWHFEWNTQFEDKVKWGQQS